MKTCPSTPVLIISILSIRVNLPGCRSCRFSTPFSDKGKSSSAFQILHIDHLFHQILRDKLENCDMQNKRNIITSRSMGFNDELFIGELIKDRKSTRLNSSHVA